MRLRPILLLVAVLAASGSTVLAAGPASGTAPTRVPVTHAITFDPASPNPILSWDAVPGAAKYRVQIAQTDSFGSPTYDRETVGLQVTPDQNLPLTSLFWRVAAEDTSGQSGPFSDATSFTTSWHRAPALVTPDDVAVLSFPNDPAVLTWRPLSGARAYEVQVDDSADFINAFDYQTANTSYVLAEPQTVGQSYYWRVRGLSAATGVVSDWSTIRSYSYSWPSTPTLVRPADGSTVADPSLAWQPVPGAYQYQVQVSANRDFTNNIVVDTNVKGAAYSPNPTLPNGAYYWRVRPFDASTAQHYGNWSTVWSFTRPASPAPQILAPLADGDPSGVATVLDTPTLAWTPVDHAAYYELQVSTDPSFPSPILSCTTNHTRWTSFTYVNPALAACQLDTLTWLSGTTYYWRVRGVDAPSGIVGVWSSASQGAFRFIRAATTPTIEQPANGATVSTPTLVWDTVDGALSYRVTIKNSNNALAMPVVTTFATSYTPTTSLTPGTYSWTVQSVDIKGATSGISVNAPPQTFTIAAPSTTYATPEPTSTPTSSIRMPALAWKPVTNATHYTVHLAAYGTDLGTLTTTQPFAAFTPTVAPLAPNTYTWWVEAFSSTNALLGTGSQSTFTIVSIGRVDPSSLSTVYQNTATPNADTVCGGNVVCGDTPTFSWTSIPDATTYQVTVATDKDFTTIAHVYTTRYPTLTPRESYLDSQAGQAYYWFVAACTNMSSSPTCGASADDPSVNAGAPSFKKRSRGVVLCPSDTSLPSNATLCPLSQLAPDPTRQITFSWADYLKFNAAPSDGTPAAVAAATQEARQYLIQVSTVADFASVADSATVDGTSYTPYNKTYPVGPLYWRVQAIDNSGNSLTWSDTAQINKMLDAPLQNITVDRNEATPPPAPSVTGVPLLTWQPSDFAARYNVEIYRNDMTFTAGNRILSATTKFTGYSPTVSLPPDTYAWRVQGVDADGRSGPWYTDTVRSPDQERITFTMTTPYPSLTLPADGTKLTSGNVLFTWDPVAEAVQYRWQLSTASGFSSVAVAQPTVMTSWSPQTTFPDGAYFWRVQALDASGNVLSSSAPRAISKDSTAPTAVSLAPLYGPAITDSFNAAFSEPVHGVTTSSFRVVPQGSTTPAAGVVTASGTTATWTPTSPLIPGQTYTISVTNAIVDSYNNPLVPTSWTVRMATSVETSSSAVIEHWDRDTAASASGGSYDSSATAGANANYTFTGTAVSLVGLRAKTGGYAAVYIDGKLQSSTVSFYSSVTQFRRAVWAKSGLAAGTHTLLVKVLGTKPTAATDHWVYLDAFQVGSTTVDQTSTAVNEHFARIATPNASSGSYDTVGHATSGDTSSRPSYTVNLRGTSLTVVGTMAPSSGKAAIYVDNVLRATVSLYRSATAYRSGVYSLSGLADKIHSVRIEPVGTPTGAASAVGIDYLQVT